MIPLVNVTTTIRDHLGAPVAGAKVYAKLSSLDLYQHEYVYPVEQVYVADGAGLVTMSLFPNAIGEKNTVYTIKATDAAGDNTYLNTTAVVPNAATTLDAIAGTGPVTPQNTFVGSPIAIPFYDQLQKYQSYLKNFNTGARNYIFPDVAGTVAVLNGALVIGVSVGLLSLTAAGDLQARTLQPPAAGITIGNANGSAGNPTFALANDLGALEGIALTGMAARTAADTWAVRTFQGTTNQVSIANADGVAGNPTFSLPQNINSGASPTFAGMTLSGIGNTQLVYSASGVMTGNANLTYNGSQVLTLTSNSTNATELHVKNTDTNGRDYILLSTGNSWGTVAERGSYLIYDSLAGSRFQINSSGNAFINGNTTLGTTSGNAHVANGTLQVLGNTNVSLQVQRAGGGDWIRMGANTAGNGAVIDVTEATQSDYKSLSMFFSTLNLNARTGIGATALVASISNATTAFTGAVGINATPSGAALHVEGGAFKSRVDSAAFNPSIWVDTNASGQTWNIGPGAGSGGRGNWNFDENGTMRVAIQKGGVTTFNKTSGGDVITATTTAGSSKTAYLYVDATYVSFGNAATIAGDNLYFDGTTHKLGVQTNNVLIFNADDTSGIQMAAAHNLTMTTGKIVSNSGSNPLLLGINGNTRLEINTSGFTKMSDAGTFNSESAAYHELRSSTANDTAYISNTHASTPFGITIKFTAATPNNTAQYFFTSIDSTGEKITGRSNGGIANFSANNVNLSDRTMKNVLGVPGAQRALFRALEIETGGYIGGADHDLMFFTAQQVQTVYPELVTPFDSQGKLGIREHGIQMRAYKVIQEHDDELVAQASMISMISTRLAEVERRVGI